MSDERRDHSLLWIEVAGAVGVTPVAHTCPVGCTDKVIMAVGSKNEAIARATYWTLSDTVGTHEISPVKTLTAVAERHGLYEYHNFAEPLILHQAWSLQFNVTALAGGAVAFFHLLVERRRGETAGDG